MTTAEEHWFCPALSLFLIAIAAKEIRIQKTLFTEKDMVSRYLIFCAMLLFGIGTAAAEGFAAFGPQVGFYKLQGSNESRTMGGLAMRLRLSENLGIQGSINYREERYLNGFIQTQSWPVLVTGQYFFSPHIFALAGTGWYNTSVEYHYPITNPPGTNVVEERKQEFGWHFGGGIELPLGLGTKITSDIKYVFLDYAFNNFPGAGGVNSNFYVISVGFLFGL
jgi:hypothetical protein